MKQNFGNACRMVVPVLVLCGLSFCQEPQKVSTCELKNNASAYNHKLVQVTSFVSHGFEDFTLQDPDCDSKLDVWLEYGGKSASGTMYCCGVTDARTRPTQVEVEGISIPLLEDENCRQFDKLLQVPRVYAMVHATIEGRFFSGREMPDRNGKRWGGYGHMGCCSLLVIQQVFEVDPHDRGDLDYESYVDQPDMAKLKCGSYRDLMEMLPYPEMRKAQDSAETADGEWAFDNPQRVAEDGLAKLLNLDLKSLTGIQQVRQSQGRVIYNWHQAGKKRYMVVVNRPYWLSLYSHRQGKVAWVMAAAYEECSN